MNQTNDYKRVLTIQDISCFGQCSLTVALPIISACGHETAIIPSAVLSTHTGGFTGYTFRDLTEDIPHIMKHWEVEQIKYDVVYTGYLGSVEQIEYIKQIKKTLLRENGKLIVDPAMGDHGMLYPAFNKEYVEKMLELCLEADIIIPNITEACYLTGIKYQDKYDQTYISNLLNELKQMGAKTIILTGVSYTDNSTGVVVYNNKEEEYYEHELLPKGCHGTGDVYASAFVGALLCEHSLFDSARIAAEYTLECIKYTRQDESHWYGVMFEKKIPYLIELLKK